VRRVRGGCEAEAARCAEEFAERATCVAPRLLAPDGLLLRYERVSGETQLVLAISVCVTRVQAIKHGGHGFQQRVVVWLD